MIKRYGHLQIIAGVILVMGLWVTAPCGAWGADLDIYSLNPVKDSGFIVAGFVLTMTGASIIRHVDSPDPGTLDGDDIFAPDRFARKYYSKNISRLSDNTRNAALALGFLTTATLLTDRHQETFLAVLTDGILFLESGMIIGGLTECVKGLSHRPRPYAYNSHVSLAKRGERNASLSFWSGHTAAAFTAAVAAGSIFQSRHPGSRLVAPVWICGLSCATATGILRVRSGNHFPTDVIAAAGAGTLTGWLVPRMHRDRNNRFRPSTVINGSGGLGIVYMF